MKLDEIYISIRDKYPIPDKYEFGEDIVIILKGEIIKKEERTNHNGTADLIQHFKATDFSVQRK